MPSRRISALWNSYERLKASTLLLSLQRSSGLKCGVRRKVECELGIVGPASLPREHGVEAVDDELPGRREVLVALPQRLDPIRVKDHVVAFGRDPFRGGPERFAALVDHGIRTEALRDLNLVQRAHHAVHAAAGGLAELEEGAADTARGRVYQHGHKPGRSRKSSYRAKDAVMNTTEKPATSGAVSRSGSGKI
jgi:hypothetical protein